MKKIMGIIGIALLLLVSCASKPKVSYVESGSQTDISGYWNDSDVKRVCESLINDCLNSPRVSQAIAAMGGRTPMVLVGTFANESSEHIDTAIITSTMEAAIFNSGKMDFVAGGKTREEIRAERQAQADLGYTSDNTLASMTNETGADFMLTGTIRTIIQKEGNESIRTYFVNAEMTNMETTQRMWMQANSDIKKRIVRPKNKL